jgi:hypothetical protein
MIHDVDGFRLRFTGRNTWRAEYWSEDGQRGVVPVAWEHNLRMSGEEDFLKVMHRKKYRAEMDAHLADGAPFIVALAKAKDPKATPKEFKEFKCVFEVVSTGRRLSDRTIETRILRRITGGAGH